MMSKTLIVASVLAVALSACNKRTRRRRPLPTRLRPPAPRALGHLASAGSGAQHHARRRLHHARRLDHSGVLIRRSAEPRSVVEE